MWRFLVATLCLLLMTVIPVSATCPTSANKTVILSGTTGTITDSNNNTWGVPNGSGQVFLNGTTLPATLTLAFAEIAYVNGVVWGETTGGNWYSFTAAGAIASGPTTVNPLVGNFKVSGGNILTPTGQIFNGRGMAIDDGNLTSAITNAAGAPLTSLFPNINFVRAAMHLNNGSCSNAYNWGIDLPSSFTNQIQWLTSLGIVVIIENHAYPQTCSVQTGAQLTDEVGWYQAWATAYANNPLVWFGAPNEPVYDNEAVLQTAVTTEQVAIYNGIRSVGNNSIVELEEVAGGPEYVLGISCSSGACLSPASAYQSMTNVIWDLHIYAYCCNGQTNLIPTATILSTIQSYIPLAQQFTSADGTVPVVIGEYGPSTTGSTYDTSGNNTVAAVEETGTSTLAWNYYSGDCCNNTTNGSNSGLTSPYGTTVAAYIAAGQGPVTALPSINAPATLTAQISTVTAVGQITATDAPYPNDTMSFTGTSTGSGTLSATGATGNGTGTITFSGSLTALNTLLGTVQFEDAVSENPVLTWTMTDQHSLTAQATTNVTVTGAVSPNCTIVTTVGPVITSAGPPSATWSINSSAQIVVNGVVDTTTANVVELAYVSGVVWQANTSGNWYSKVAPSNTWSGPTTTNPTTGCSSSSITVSAPATVSGVYNSSTPIPNVSVADPAHTTDTMTFSATATQGGKLYATGATGTGTSTIGFTGSLAALNSLLSTLTAVVPGAVICLAGNNCSITDNNGNVWTINTSVNNGQVYENGVLPNGQTSSNVMLIALINGVVVWHENTSLQWYYWSGTVWLAGPNPIGTPYSATVAAGTGASLSDPAGNVWTINTSVNNGEVYENGVLPNGQTSSNVTNIYLVAGVVWQLNSSSQWYSWSGTAWVAGTNPIGASVTSVVTFSVTDQHSGTGTASTTINMNQSAASPNITVTRSSGCPISDLLGEQFTITSGGQIAVGGVTDTTTANVVELAYANGNIWQWNTAGNWYYKASAAATWQGPTTVGPINRPNYFRPR